MMPARDVLRWLNACHPELAGSFALADAYGVLGAGYHATVSELVTGFLVSHEHDCRASDVEPVVENYLRFHADMAGGDR